jgi:hypothetical protein
LDISLEAAPASETLPSNVKLRKWDVRDDIPEDLVNFFAVVHVRFSSFVLMNDEVSEVGSKLVKMLSRFALGLFTYYEPCLSYNRDNQSPGSLEPGGYLQWGDSNVASIRVDKTRLDTRTENLEQLMKLMTIQYPRFNPTWVTELPKFFSSAGFESIDTDIFDAPPYWAFLSLERSLMIN